MRCRWRLVGTNIFELAPVSFLISAAYLALGWRLWHVPARLKRRYCGPSREALREVIGVVL